MFGFGRTEEIRQVIESTTMALRAIFKSKGKDILEYQNDLSVLGYSYGLIEIPSSVLKFKRKHNQKLLYGYYELLFPEDWNSIVETINYSFDEVAFTQAREQAHLDAINLMTNDGEGGLPGLSKYLGTGCFEAPNETGATSSGEGSDENISNNISSALGSQVKMISNNDGNLRETAKDNWSLGYVGGFCDFILQCRNIDMGTSMAVVFLVYLGIFGKEDAENLYKAFLNLQSDTELRDGIMAGGEDAEKWLENNDVIILGWVNHVSKISE